MIKNPIYASIPFVSDPQNRTMRLEIQSLVKRFYPQINLHLSFKSDFSIGSLFSYKDKIPSSMRSNVVYSYTVINVMIHTMVRLLAILELALLNIEDFLTVQESH